LQTTIVRTSLDSVYSRQYGLRKVGVWWSVSL
jgi:hypothetical protein